MISLGTKQTRENAMSILSFSTHREFASWFIWLLVLICLVCPQGAGQLTAASTGYPGDIWQSSFEPVPWLGRFLRLRWYAAWWRIRKRVNE
jgi:hypothetical protein